MTVAEKYIKLVEDDILSVGEAYLEINKELELFAKHGDLRDKHFRELLLVSTCFARTLAQLYLEDHGLVP